MALNTSPIFTGTPDIQGGDILTTGSASDFTGQTSATAVVFSADEINGGFIQRLRFKPIASGANIATVARIYINNGGSRVPATVAAVAGTPTGTPSTTGGSLSANTSGYFARIVAVDQYGARTAASTESAAVTITGTTGSIVWNWTAVTGAESYRVYVGPVTGIQTTYFTTSTNSFTQIDPTGIRDNLGTSVNNNNYFVGEVSLPATATTTAAATVEIDYPLNVALPAGYRILVALGTTVATGWQVTAFGGKY